ncbi:MAG: hypothetical protein RSD17_01670, partial [Oscillospiraceae bacterium]
SVLMGITMGMISSSGRMFASSSSLSIDKMVGDAIFDSIESVAQYATHIELANSESECLKKYDQAFYIEQKQDSTNSGLLKYKSKNSKVTNMYNESPYSDSFYQGRTIKYSVTPYKYSDDKTSDRHLSITIVVCRDEQEVYKRTDTIRCINLGLLGDGESSNLIVTNSKNKLKDQNQYISFSCDEQLVMTEVEGYKASSDAMEIITDYNQINNELKMALEQANRDNPTDENARNIAKNEAATEAREEIKDLFGGYTPRKIVYAENDEMKYFNGVHATKEEVFYGLLLDRYAVNGKVTVDSYPKFKDPEKEFANSTFDGYRANMVQLALFKMNDNTGYDVATQTYSPSQILDYNLYSVRWGEWFDDWNSYKLKIFPLRIEKTVHSIDFNEPDNVYGWTNRGKRSFNKAFIVFHQDKSTWYYQPTVTTGLSPVDKAPKLYDLSDKSSGAVMRDIDSNSVGEYTEEIMFGPNGYTFTITKVNHTSSTIWNSLPAGEIGLP